MPPKKKKIIRRRKITKADVKRIPKVSNIKPNINLSPYDIANMVQQKFRQDMDADKVQIEKRQAELQAERNALQSPEIQRLMNDVARLNRTVQLQQRQNQNEQLRVELDADATAIGSEEYHEGMVEVKQLERQTDLTRRQNNALLQMEDAKADEEVIESRLKADQKQRDQNKTYKKKLDTEANRLARMTLNVQHLQRMKAIRDQEDEERKLEVASKVRDEVAEQYIAEEGEAQARVEMMQLVNQRRRDTMNERITAGVSDAKARKMEEMLPQVSEDLAAKELEIQKLQREAELAEQKQKALQQYQTKLKQYELTKNEMTEHLKKLKQDDPTSRITGDPSLLEVDLQMLGEDQERYKDAYRQTAETLAFRRMVLAADKEASAIREQIDASRYGPMFEQFYGNEGAFVRAVGNLAQLRQGRAVVFDEKTMSQVFPAVIEAQKRNEREAEALALREGRVSSREETVGAREQQMNEIDNQLRDTQAIVRSQEQQIAWYRQQYG